MAVLAQILWGEETDTMLYSSSMHQYGLALHPGLPDCTVECEQNPAVTYREFGGVRW